MFIDEMNRKTKKTGKRLCTASPEPVRSAANAPSAPKPIETMTAKSEQHDDAERARREAHAGDQADDDVDERLDDPDDGDPAELAGEEHGARIGVSDSRLRKPVWMSRARSVPAFMVAKSAPWMNGTASAKATNECVGNPGRLVAESQPARVDREQEQREDEREDDVRGLARGAHDRAAREQERLVAGARSRGLPRPRAPPARRRPRASGRSSRGRRRRATAGAARAARPRSPRRRARGRCRRAPTRRCSARTARAVGATRTARRSARAPPPCGRASSFVAGTASIVGRPISALSAPGVPSATIRPWSMIPTRSASTSASSRYWVVRKTVTPSCLARRSTSSQSAVRLCTSRPVVGSSRKRTRGRWTSASARSSRRFMPPE